MIPALHSPLLILHTFPYTLNSSLCILYLPSNSRDRSLTSKKPFCYIFSSCPSVWVWHSSLPNSLPGIARQLGWFLSIMTECTDPQGHRFHRMYCMVVLLFYNFAKKRSHKFPLTPMGVRSTLPGLRTRDPSLNNSPFPLLSVQLGAHAKFQNRSTNPSGRKVTTEERKKCR